MIPKIIHYCWFGSNPMPPIVLKCIESWKAKMPDYEIKLWNEENVPIKEYKFMKDAYSVKKWAFVSDYARYWILYQYGGFFLDCDVEALDSFEKLRNQNIFFAFNKHVKKSVLFVNPGLIIGAIPHCNIIKDILDKYDSVSFLNEVGKPNLHYSSPRILTNYLIENSNIEIYDKVQHLSNGVTIYSTDYFDPINPRKLYGNKLEITPNTVGIHHCAASWVPRSRKIRLYLSIIIRNIFGDKLIDTLRGKEKMVYGQ